MSITNFWYRWPSLAVELFFGGLLGIVTFAVSLGNLGLAGVLALVVSYVYERWLDPNRILLGPAHDPIKDIGQRALGSAITLTLLALLFS